MIARGALAPAGPFASASGERFAVQLATATPEDELRAWFEAAAPGARAIYASGAVLPHDAPGVALARQLGLAGAAHLLRERDRRDGRRWNFIIEKAGCVPPLTRCQPGPGGSLPAARATLPPDMPRLLAVLRALERDAEGWAVCPSNGALARQLGHGGSGRGRAKYLLALAQRHGLIALESHGRNAPRRVKLMEGGDA